jgi:hypothetical protein
VSPVKKSYEELPSMSFATQPPEKPDPEQKRQAALHLLDNLKKLKPHKLEEHLSDML